jgi:O-antigen/teichoic acid export membrane protein
MTDIRTKSFTKNYFQIYLWKGISMVLNLLSLFLVVPRLSESPLIYGIYAICASVSVYLSYADIGFYGAGVKYAAEAYARDDRKQEYKYIGFSLFILTVFVGLIGVVFFVLSFHPSLLIKDIEYNDNWGIASKLLLIQSVFTVNTILQRFVNATMNIRLENFVSQKTLIISSLIKIGSVFIFFKPDHYDIVGYFLFLKSADFVAHLINLLIVKYRYNYDFLEFLRCFRFNSHIYKRVKSLAFGSFYVTVLWVFYYELDQIAIGRFLGAQEVAIFAVAFTILTYYRNISGMIFSPFQARFNHFRGLGKIQELKKFYFNVIKITMPIVIFSVLPILILSEQFILSWVGSEYIDSAQILFCLVFSNLFLFISIPASNMIVTLEKVRLLYVINTWIAVIYWSGVLLFVGNLGVLAFAIFKLVSFSIATLFYLDFTLKFLEITLMKFVKETLFRILIPVLISAAILIYVRETFFFKKSSNDLFMVLVTFGVSASMAMIVYYLISKELRDFGKQIWHRLKLKN